ncbi:hypothetical protein MHM39_14385 [Phaeobacter sp. CNT1-3]|nr:hypothetical protein [Phaeobacter sp. CNT1-3]
MKSIVLGGALLLLGAVTANAAIPFNSSSVWEMDCVMEPKLSSKPNATFSVIWNRDQSIAHLVWPNGNGKGLREINGFTDTDQHSAHFYYSPATAKLTGQKTKEARYGGWLEGFGPSFFSVRSTGHAVLTNHDIIHGGMKAYSHEGRCTLTPKMMEMQ